jgi:two-component system chemotaxis response regulator CheY
MYAPGIAFEPFAPREEAGKESVGGDHMRSLVAEDDATSRVVLQKFLLKFGDCDIAVNGREAVQAVKKAQLEHRAYDLVCMDLHMPVMDGQEAIREIRAREADADTPRKMKIIVTTALSDMGNITSALLGKCNGYMMKPIDIAKLRSELKDLGLVK